MGRRSYQVTSRRIGYTLSMRDFITYHFIYGTRTKRLSVFRYDLRISYSKNTCRITQRCISLIWTYRTQRAGCSQCKPCQDDSPEAQGLPPACTGKLTYSGRISSETSRASRYSLRDLWHNTRRSRSALRHRAISRTYREDRIIPSQGFFLTSSPKRISLYYPMRQQGKHGQRTLRAFSVKAPLTKSW